MRLLFLLTVSAMLLSFPVATVRGADEVEAIVDRVASHNFHPLNNDHSFTVDRGLGKHGVADLNDRDWLVRTLAIRDLLRQIPANGSAVRNCLQHESEHVRQIAAFALGIAGDQQCIPKLQFVLQSDSSSLVRAQAVMSLGQLLSSDSKELISQKLKDDSSKDVRHQCELALDQIEKGAGVTKAMREAFESLSEDTFGKLQVGRQAPKFTLSDTTGEQWSLADQRGKWTVLVWIFADWCPVCHGEFNDLIKMKDQFDAANTTVATVECHDLYRCRLMVGKELDPTYWFSKNSFQQRYLSSIWWPHLSDPAGKIGATYGVDPMAFAVHAEYVNRPSTIIIDPTGIVRFAYYGTYWGDRPSIHETLEMIQSEQFEYQNPSRLDTISAQK